MDITDLYSTRIQQTFDDDQAEIIAIFKANPKASLKLINYYKGLPLNYSASIASVDRGTVDLDVQAEQAFTIEQGRYTFIRSPLFKHDLFAQAQYVNVKKRAATFTKFSYIEIMAERRNFIRMELDWPINALIETPQQKIAAQLFDISLSGLNALVQDFCPLDVNSEVTISFELQLREPDETLKAVIPARLLGIVDDARPYKYKFAINTDRSIERQLSKFIFQRQIDIIKEIKDATL